MGRGEGRHAVALPAAEEVVDGHAQRLALVVVVRDVDGRHGGGEHPPALEMLAPVELLPKGADAHRVLPDHEPGKVVDGPGDRLLAAGEAGFAPAVEALVGLDLDEELIADADPGGEGLGRGDPRCFTRRSAMGLVAEKLEPGFRWARAASSFSLGPGPGRSSILMNPLSIGGFSLTRSLHHSTSWAWYSMTRKLLMPAQTWLPATVAIGLATLRGAIGMQ